MNGAGTAKPPRYKKRHPGGPKQHLKPPWKKGDPSPNPLGAAAPKAAFRQQCRDGAQKLLQRLLDGDYEAAKAFEAIADRAGYLPLDRQVASLLKVMESPALQNVDRQRALNELVGPPDPEASAREPESHEPDKLSVSETTNGAAKPADDGENR